LAATAATPLRSAATAATQPRAEEPCGSDQEAPCGSDQEEPCGNDQKEPCGEDHASRGDEPSGDDHESGDGDQEELGFDEFFYDHEFDDLELYDGDENAATPSRSAATAATQPRSAAKVVVDKNGARLSYVENRQQQYVARKKAKLSCT
jgi:hypothetical protein